MKPKFEIRSRVKRIASNHTSGRVGTILEIKGDRARVAWDGNPRTWVNFRFLTPLPADDITRGPWVETPFMRSHSAFRECQNHATGEKWHEYQH